MSKIPKAKKGIKNGMPAKGGSKGTMPSKPVAKKGKKY